MPKTQHKKKKKRQITDMSVGQFWLHNIRVPFHTALSAIAHITVAASSLGFFYLRPEQAQPEYKKLSRKQWSSPIIFSAEEPVFAYYVE